MGRMSVTSRWMVGSTKRAVWLRGRRRQQRSVVMRVARKEAVKLGRVWTAGSRYCPLEVREVRLRSLMCACPSLRRPLLAACVRAARMASGLSHPPHHACVGVPSQKRRMPQARVCVIASVVQGSHSRGNTSALCHLTCVARGVCSASESREKRGWNGEDGRWESQTL